MGRKGQVTSLVTKHEMGFASRVHEAATAQGLVHNVQRPADDRAADGGRQRRGFGRGFGTVKAGVRVDPKLRPAKRRMRENRDRDHAAKLRTRVQGAQRAMPARRF